MLLQISFSNKIKEGGAHQVMLAMLMHTCPILVIAAPFQCFYELFSCDAQAVMEDRSEFRCGNFLPHIALQS
jgi:hypothetical protein